MNIIKNTDDVSVMSQNSQKPMLVDFWAEWCGPCRMLLPIIEELSSEMGNVVDIYKCNVDECPDVASTFNIRSIPTLIIFKEGKTAATHNGAASKAVVKQWIESNI